MRLDREAKYCVEHSAANKAALVVRAKIKRKKTLRFDHLMETKKHKAPEGGVPNHEQDTRTLKKRAVSPE